MGETGSSSGLGEAGFVVSGPVRGSPSIAWPGLADQPRSGRPRRCQLPADSGVPLGPGGPVDGPEAAAWRSRQAAAVQALLAWVASQPSDAHSEHGPTRVRDRRDGRDGRENR